jgi:CelD/BcsL family acetyltransferase involved in cellulose biosynthesis
LDRWCADRGASFVCEEKHGWVVEIAGRSYDEIASEWSKKFRGNMNRYPRKLAEELGPLEFEVVRERDRVLAMLPAYFEMHNRRWIESGSPGTFTDATMRAFFKDLAERFADTHLHFSVLRAGGTPVAYHFGFFYAGYLLVYKSTYDPDHNGAGKVLQRMLIEEGARSGWAGIDLLQGDYAYKERMATRPTTTRSYLVRTHAVAPGHFWLTRGRPAVQRTMGGLIFKAVGRWDALKQRFKG